MEETATYRWQERRLGRTVLRTYRDNVDLDDVVPNPKQPRMGPKVDPELQRQIEANEGVFEPLLLEPHPDIPNKFRIIDGDRRWTNSKILVENQKKEEYRRLPAEVTDRTLTDERGSGSGFISTAKGASGTRKKKKWSPTALWIWWDGRARQTSSG
jgi:hypothetical protein